MQLYTINACTRHAREKANKARSQVGEVLAPAGPPAEQTHRLVAFRAIGDSDHPVRLHRVAETRSLGRSGASSLDLIAGGAATALAAVQGSQSFQ